MLESTTIYPTNTIIIKLFSNLTIETNIKIKTNIIITH